MPAITNRPSANIEFEDASLTYKSDSGAPVHAVDRLNLTVAPGEFVAVIGPSGCGKSSMMKAVAGLLELTSGKVKVAGAEVRGPGLDRAVVFQEAALMPWRTVEGNVQLGLEALKIGKRERQQVSQEFLRLVGLKGFEEAYPHQLSGGMRQRVGLARALAVDPAVLLMDEPFAALDAQTRERMATELLRVWSAKRKAVLFITHSIEEAIHLADRVVVLSYRPARLLYEVNIDLARPRDEEVRGTTRFAELRQELWHVLSAEVKKAEIAEESLLARPDR